MTERFVSETGDFNPYFEGAEVNPFLRSVAAMEISKLTKDFNFGVVAYPTWLIKTPKGTLRARKVVVPQRYVRKQMTETGYLYMLDISKISNFDIARLPTSEDNCNYSLFVPAEKDNKSVPTEWSFKYQVEVDKRVYQSQSAGGICFAGMPLDYALFKRYVIGEGKEKQLVNLYQYLLNIGRDENFRLPDGKTKVGKIAPMVWATSLFMTSDGVTNGHLKSYSEYDDVQFVTEDGYPCHFLIPTAYGACAAVNNLRKSNREEGLVFKSVLSGDKSSLFLLDMLAFRGSKNWYAYVLGVIDLIFESGFLKEAGTETGMDPLKLRRDVKKILTSYKSDYMKLKEAVVEKVCQFDTHSKFLELSYYLLKYARKRGEVDTILDESSTFCKGIHGIWIGLLPNYRLDGIGSSKHKPANGFFDFPCALSRKRFGEGIDNEVERNNNVKEVIIDRFIAFNEPRV